MQNHHRSENPDGIHRSILEVDIFFDSLNIVKRQLSDHESADTITDEDQRYREGKCECTEHAIDGESHIDDFEVHDLANVAHLPS